MKPYANKWTTIPIVLVFILSILNGCGSTEDSEDDVQDTTAPVNTSISINNGDTTTDFINITVKLDASDDIGVTGYFLSESNDDPSADYSGWVTVNSSKSYSGNISFTLSDGTGDKTVYAWFKDANGNVSEVTSDQIQNLWVWLLSDTNQTTRYADATGDDSHYSINPQTFIDNGDGTISDKNSGLIWQKQSDNLEYSWSDAEKYCTELKLSIYSDWRVPTRRELISILDFGKVDPSINSLFFPGLIDGQSNHYWSSTTLPDDRHWNVNFFFSSSRTSETTDNGEYFIRCVTGHESESASFNDNGNGTVTDNTTGLTWQEDDATHDQWEDAIMYCEDLNLAASDDWRLPNSLELETIVDYSFSNPAVNTDYFPTAKPYWYWTSTTHIGSEAKVGDYSYAKWVHFNAGEIFASKKINVASNSHLMHTRCVRGGN